MSAPDRLVVVANARLPSHRAQSLQVVHAASAFARAGAATSLIHALRRRTPALPDGQSLFDYYAVPPGALPSVEGIPCVDWIDSVPRSLQFGPARLQEQTFARAAARRVLRAHQGKAVLSREIETARALVRRGFDPVFLEVHSVPRGRLRRRWLVEAARGSRGCVAISGGVRSDLLELGVPADLVFVEHDAFEPTRFASLPCARDARRELGIRSKGPLVVYTGGLLEWKGADVLVAAAARLPSVQIVIVGGMPADVERLREKARRVSNVRVEGFQSPARIGLYLAAADLGTVPNRSAPEISSRYTSPLKVFEAMAVGLPLVASDLPSLREILKHGEDAWLVAPDDPEALAAGIQHMLRSPDLSARMGSRLKRRAAGHSWDERARRILAWMGGRCSPASS